MRLRAAIPLLILIVVVAAAGLWLAGRRPPPPAGPGPSGDARQAGAKPAPPPLPFPSSPPVPPASPAPSGPIPATPTPQVPAAPASPGPSAGARPEPAPDYVIATRAHIESISYMLRDFRTVMGENPVGSNAEIMKAVNGGNPKGARLGPPEGLQLNQQGELVDSWGTPFFFHQNSATHMDIISAGPDKKLGTADDVKGR